MPHTLNAARPSSLGLEAFLAHYGDIFEHSPWVAETAWKQGLTTQHDDADVLADTMGAVLRNAAIDEQIAVIRAHPDLAGKAALAGELTQDSTREQAGAGLDQCSTEEFERFQRMNQAYQDKFGFPFVIAVKGLDRHAILAAFETRLENDAATERQTAIDQIIQIARFRLHVRAEMAE
ncbi:2-oxo-4-hydroxy-4-carboxy-5-ureidoimidazoline decarboxylase [Halomonas sp. M1]|uniref:2-oxo-4-hydroxy-4-carboxy-5-ureidoimidazoline decarboxylase n=1 Tax=Halomonas sp. M1 TaxID=3035470 RepID=UPI002484FBA2|nr:MULTISPECIES: 2-oxo-4-hydroxy-4-carboxy-5-ureidoimidazoline decarboxylase [unclassified Halomonas]MDP3534720.1 2-oxo-4-hydroxy-4-carboxy-5-ureidoimidazoline decarboxylase [Halomonas sp.]WFE69994.1 2-oxo-4-hydroxy-4-carboxy-5-ureidoimidazoline decarboxylase [Halomonas sp. M1]